MARLAIGAIVGDKYRLEREVARGGMGSVWRAQHLHLDAPVAIKFMDPSLGRSAEARERFTREAKAAAQIQSPYVLHISDYGLDEDTPYIVMELLAGEDLDTRMLRGTLSLQGTERLVTQTAKGLRKAHEAGIVHRDLKPSNLFLAGDTDDWTVKIVDFGVAKAAGAAPVQAIPPPPSHGHRSGEVTHTGMVLGSPQYMSPEQARGFKEVDASADLWALATIAFRALTGRRLFEGLEAMQVLTQLIYEPLPVPSQAAPELPSPLQRFFDRALSREGPRFGTARELADAFSSAVAEVSGQQDAGSISGATVPSLPSLPGASDEHVLRPLPHTRLLPKLAIAAAALCLGAVMIAGVVVTSEGGPPARLTPGLAPRGIGGVPPVDDRFGGPGDRAEASAGADGDPADEDAKSEDGTGGEDGAAESKTDGRARPPRSEADPRPQPARSRRTWGF